MIKFLRNFEFRAVQKCANLVDLEKCPTRSAGLGLWKKMTATSLFNDSVEHHGSLVEHRMSLVMAKRAKMGHLNIKGQGAGPSSKYTHHQIWRV